MTVGYLAALAGIAVSLSVLAWLVQQRGGNSGWLDTIWTFSVGLIGAGSTPWRSQARGRTRGRQGSPTIGQEEA
jgi:steroid 5-alpha reductase family enzyme